MKTIKVVAAVIRDGDKIFATQRGYGDLKGGWEFPGGKIEEGERQWFTQRSANSIDMNRSGSGFARSANLSCPCQENRSCL